jgi:DNA-binding NarL/FixJ family response regulator
MTMAMQPTMPEPPNHDRSPLGLVWVTPHYSVVAAGLERLLIKAKAHVLWGQEPPEDTPSLVVLCANGGDLASEVRNLQAQAPEAPVLVLGLQAELPLARAALQAGAKGFIHAQMPPEQVVRALEVVTKKGEHVVPRELLKALVEEGEPQAELAKLTPQKRAILGWAAEGLSNAQIARRSFLSVSTIKQHLRAIYKVLGVKNRTEAATVLQRSEQLGAADATAPSESERRRLTGGPSGGGA